MSLIAYSQVISSGVDWIGNIPAYWIMTKVKRVCKFTTGWTPPTGNASAYEGENLWANISDLGERVVYETSKRISDQAIKEAGIALSPAGSLLFSFKLSIGQVSIAGEDMYTNEAIATFRRSQDLSIGYAFYAFPLFLIQNASENIYGAKLLNQERIKNGILALPPIGEQVAIAAFLDRETGKIDALIAEQEKLLTLLAEKRQATISHVVTRGLNPNAPMRDSGVAWLGNIPENWKMVRLKDCGCEIVDCKNRTPELCADGEYFVVRTSCVKDGKFDPEPGYFTDKANFIEWTVKGLPRKGDVLFTREAPTGEACLAPTGLDFCLGQRMMYIRPPENKLASEFLLYSIYGGLARERIREKSKGSTVGHLRVGEVGELPLLLPPLSEQLSLVKFLSEEIEKLDALSTASEHAISMLNERRSALIAAAVTGKIDVRNAVAEELAA